MLTPCYLLACLLTGVNSDVCPPDVMGLVAADGDPTKYFTCSNQTLIASHKCVNGTEFNAHGRGCMLSPVSITKPSSADATAQASSSGVKFQHGRLLPSCWSVCNTHPFVVGRSTRYVCEEISSQSALIY